MKQLYIPVPWKNIWKLLKITVMENNQVLSALGHSVSECWIKPSFGVLLLLQVTRILGCTSSLILGLTCAQGVVSSLELCCMATPAQRGIWAALPHPCSLALPCPSLVKPAEPQLKALVPKSRCREQLGGSALCSCRVRASLVGMLWDCSTPPAASAWKQSCHFQTHGAVSSAFPEELWPSGHSCQCLVGREMLFSLPILVAGSPHAAAPPAPLPALA